MFRVLSGIDFMQKSYGEYYTLPQTTCTRNTLNFVNIKNEFVKIYLSYGISFIEALGESVRKVCWQFLYACRITLHKSLHNTIELES